MWNIAVGAAAKKLFTAFYQLAFFSRNQINNLCAVYNNNERPKSGFFVCYMLPASCKLHFLWFGVAKLMGWLIGRGWKGKNFFIRRKSKFFENIKLLVHFQPLPLSYVLQPRLLLKICASNWWIPFKSLDSKDSRINKTLSLKNFIKIWWPLCQNFSFLKEMTLKLRPPSQKGKSHAFLWKFSSYIDEIFNFA